MPKLLIKRGTRAQLNAAASGSALNAGEPYLITDEGRLAVGTAAGTYEAAAKESHTHVTGDVSGLGTIATQAASSVSITGGAISGVTLSASSVTVAGATDTLYLKPDQTALGGTYNGSWLENRGGRNLTIFGNADGTAGAGLTLAAYSAGGWVAGLMLLNNPSGNPNISLLPLGGSVLIGTTTSTGPKLEVNGSIAGTSLTATGLTSGRIPVAGTGGLLGNSVIVTDGGGVSFGTSAVAISGKVHAVTSANESAFVIENTDGVGKMWNISAPAAYGYGVNFSEMGVADGRLFIKTGGNVGIGTTNPGAKLEVNGDIKAKTIKLDNGTSAGVAVQVEADPDMLAKSLIQCGTAGGSTEGRIEFAIGADPVMLIHAGDNNNLALEAEADVTVTAGGGIALVPAATYGVDVTSFVQLTEMTAPTAPAANGGRLYLEDNGSGKTRLCVRFASGSAIVLATEP